MHEEDKYQARAREMNAHAKEGRIAHTAHLMLIHGDLLRYDSHPQPWIDRAFRIAEAFEATRAARAKELSNG